MRSLQQRIEAAKATVVVPQSVPAPVGGWNTRDSLAEMPPTDAVILDNLFPDSNGVSLRLGYAPFADGMGGDSVETVAEFNSGGIRQLIAACSGSVFDASGGGTVGPALGNGFTSNQWQTTPFLARLFLANGHDNMQIYDGTTLGDADFTGVDTSTLWGVYQYQQRLFMWQQQSTGFWYAQLNSISGALAFYDLGSLCPNGGNLIAVTTISHDGGNGVLDYIVFIMDSGDALIFYGNDPSQPTFWQMIGRYRISPPVNIRAVCNYGAEAFITTNDDHVPLQQQLVALKVGALPPRSKASGAVKEAVAANPNAFGWQALYHPETRSLIFNIPNPDGSFDQHICNTSIEAQPWCRYTGINAQCWSLYNNNLYFGSASGKIFQASVGSLDNLGAIKAIGQSSWNMFNAAVRKRIGAICPILSGIGIIGYNFGIAFDYSDVVVPVASPGGSVGSPWNISPWNTSPWSPEQNVTTQWQVGGGSGQAVSMIINIAGTSPISWLRTDFREELGNAL